MLRAAVYGRSPFESERVAARALPLWWVYMLVVVYVVPGLVGHDPWKPDEAYVFGGVLDMLKTGDWIVVKVGGVPFVEKPPLYHWVASITAKTLSPWLQLHDGARVASGIFVMATAASVAAACHLLWGAGFGRVGAVMSLSAAGLFTNAQMMLPDLPLMAGFAIAIAGFAGCATHRPWAGIALGIGVGIGFLAKGIFAPAVLAISSMALPAFFPAWRRRTYARDLAVALAIAAPFLLVWPVALWLRSPQLFMTWFWDNNIGRYLGFSVPYLGAAADTGFWLETWPWFLFPLWPFAAAAILRRDDPPGTHAGVQVGMVVCGCIAIVLGSSASARAIYALPMIPALALVAAGSARGEHPRLNRLLQWLGIFIAGSAAVVVWYGWFALVSTGRAPDWPLLTRYFPAEFELIPDHNDVALAALLTLGFAVSCFALRAAANRGIALWVGGLATAWALVALLWVPWIDNAKSYRGVYESLRGAIPRNVNCVASLDIGESERALLEYILGIPTIDMGAPCGAVLRQRRLDQVAKPLPASWRMAWSGSRPGDDRERFELWLATPAKTVARR